MKIMSALLVALFLALTNTAWSADDGKAVVVTVNGVNLTQAELNQEISKIVPMERAFHGGISDEKMKDVKKKGMDTLIDMELQYQDGLAKDHKLDKKALEKEIDLLAAKYPDRDLYLEAVQKAGFSDEAMARFVSRNVISKKMKELEVDKKINVTDSMVKEYFEANKSRYMKPVEYRASLILIKVPASALPDQREEFRKKAEDVLLQLKNGAEFADLAAKYSDDMSRIKGGDLGYFHAGQSDDEEFDAVLQKLKVGESSPVVKSLKGFYIVKLTETKAPRQIQFDEVKEKVKSMLTTTQKEKLYNDWMSNLKQKAKITYPQQVAPVKGS